MHRLHQVLSICVVLAVLTTSAMGQSQSAEETRAKDLFHDLRCMVCQNQSIAESDADVARDLREIVRQEIAKGKSDREIKNLLVERYGEFILLRPTLAWHTVLLWGAPIFLLLGGALALWFGAKSRAAPKANALSKEEERALEDILKR